MSQVDSPDPLLPMAEVCAALGNCHRATVYRLVVEKELPPPVKIGAKSAWPQSEVAALVERLKAARNMGQNMGQAA